MHLVDLIGYAGSLFIVTSLTMSSIWWLRCINAAGASTMAIYGLLIGSYPVVCLNMLTLSTNLFYLHRLHHRQDYFSLLEVTGLESGLLTKFFVIYQADIRKHFPEFTEESLRQATVFFILRNVVPVGLFAYEKNPDGEIRVLLDYVTPNYRDLKNARFVYTDIAHLLRETGFSYFVTYSAVPVHQKYLKRMGFEQDTLDSARLVKKI